MFSFKNDDSAKKGDGKKGRILPVLPLRDIIVFPHMVVPLFVGREKSIAALEEAMKQGNEILLVTQKKAKTEQPAPEDVFLTGTLGSIIHPGLVRVDEKSVKVLLEGKKRARIKRFI